MFPSFKLILHLQVRLNTTTLFVCFFFYMRLTRVLHDEFVERLQFLQVETLEIAYK